MKLRLRPLELARFLKKASLNSSIEYVRCTISPDEITAKNSEGKRHALIKLENNIFSQFQKPFELNFWGYRKSRTKLKKYDADIISAEIMSKEEFGETKSILRLPKPPKDPDRDHETLLMGPPTLVQEFREANDFTLEGVKAIVKKKLDAEMIKTYRRQIKNKNESFIQVECGKVDLKFGDRTVELGNIRDSLITSKLYLEAKYLKNIFSVLDPEDEKYTLNVWLDANGTNGAIAVESTDKSEQYVLVGERKLGEIVKYDLSKSLKHGEQAPPQFPSKWNFDESVSKMRKLITSWKSLTKEIIDELWIAKQILTKSKADAAKIRHGTYVGPVMTWEQYCSKIGADAKTVNRWLTISFEAPQLKYANVDDEKPDSSIPKGFTSIEDVDDRWTKRVFLNLGNGKRKRKPLIEKLIQELNGGSVSDAIVSMNINLLSADWAKHLFNGLICLDEKKCSVYFGKDEKQFRDAHSDKIFLKRV